MELAFLAKWLTRPTSFRTLCFRAFGVDISYMDSILVPLVVCRCNSTKNCSKRYFRLRTCSSIRGAGLSNRREKCCGIKRIVSRSSWLDFTEPMNSLDVIVTCQWSGAIRRRDKELVRCEHWSSDLYTSSYLTSTDSWHLVNILA